jgi:hypothetical protein
MAWGKAHRDNIFSCKLYTPFSDHTLRCPVPKILGSPKIFKYIILSETNPPIHMEEKTPENLIQHICVVISSNSSKNPVSFPSYIPTFIYIRIHLPHFCSDRL